MKYLNKIFIFSIISVAVSANKIGSCTEDKTVALTFDDGPFKYTEELIDLLNENNIKATFFINIENYWRDLPNNKDKQKIIKKAHDSGHQIASHTWAHNIPSDIDEFDAMMNKTDSWIEDVIGNRPAYFRAPRGECYEECIEYLEEKNYKLIQWDTDTNDWDISSGIDYRVKTAKEFLTESWNYKRSNYLILMHDVYEHTVREIVPWIIKNKPEGYKFVTVAECLGDKYSMYRSKSYTKTKTYTTTTSSYIIPTENSDNYLDGNYYTENDNNDNYNMDNMLINNDDNNDDQGNLVYSSAHLSYKSNNILILSFLVFIIKIIIYL